MKISEVTTQTIKDYCGISDTDSDNILTALMASAKAFIIGYTGLTTETIDTYEDLSIAYMVLVNDMFTNRDYTVSNDKLNPCVSTILAMHSVNYL